MKHDESINNSLSNSLLSRLLSRVLLITTILLLSFIYTGDSVHHTTYHVEVYIESPTYIKDFRDYGLTDYKALQSFIRYIKTQSNTITSDVGKADVYYVMQTIFNRMDKANCTWLTYYNTPRINQSESIRRMKTGHLNPSFSHGSLHDQRLIAMAYSALFGHLPAYLTLPKNVMYFHSFGKQYNRNPHIQSKFVVEARHRFYSD